MRLRPASSPGRLLPLLFACVLATVEVGAARATPGVAPFWRQLRENPFAFRGQAMAVDGPNGLAYMFGGSDPDPLTNRVYRHDLDRTDLDWELVTIPGGPSPRTKSKAFFDTAGDRLLVFGGTDAIGPRKDVWAWRRSSNEWVDLTPASGSAPASLPASAVIAHDSRRHRLLYVRAQGIPRPVQVWSFSLDPDSAHWQQLSTSGLPNFSDLENTMSADYDSTGDALFLLHGSDLWRLDVATGTWSFQITGGISPGGSSIACDPDDRQLFVYSPLGQISNFEQKIALVRLDAPPGWGSLNTPGAPNGAMSVVYDRVGRRFVMTDVQSLSPLMATFSTRAPLVWTLLRRPGRPPDMRLAAGAIVPSEHAWYVHGGISPSSLECAPDPADCVSQRLHRISLDEPIGFEEVVPTGTGPGRLRSHAAVYDWLAQRILFYGGVDDAGAFHSEVWALELAGTPNWRLVPTAQPGPARADHGLAMDVDGRRLFVVAGRGSAGASSQVWQLDVGVEPAVWTQLPVSVPATESTAAFDAPGDRLLVLKGDGVGYEIELGPGGPTVGAPVDGFLPGESRRSVTFDPRRRQMLIVNGASLCGCNSGFFGQKYSKAFGGSDVPDFTDLGTTPTPPTYNDALTDFDLTSDRALVLDGNVLGPIIFGLSTLTLKPQSSIWALQFDASTPAFIDLVEVAAADDGIRVRFAGEGASGDVAVEREEDGGEFWTALGSARELGPRLYEFVDRSTSPGLAYRYRGRFWDESGEHVTAPSAPIRASSAPARLALALPHGNVTRSRALEFEVRLPRAGVATLELVDVKGRRVAALKLAGTGGAVRSVMMEPARPLRPGLYFARLRQGDESAEARVIHL